MKLTQCKANWDSDSEVDLESLMDNESDRVSEFDYQNYQLPYDFDELRSELN